MLDEWSDIDNDGLTRAQETAQSTLDIKKDTDGDGLDDRQESVWNTNRDNIFCKTSVTPYSCAYPSPVVKDLYVEIDWMKDSNNRSFKPSSTQLDLVKDAYEDKGIIFHTDMGQFGGGNELPSYVHNLNFVESPQQDSDFYNYKNGTSNIPANFLEARHKIWHYLVSGYRYTDVLGSSGVSFAGDDDTFISTGLIEDGQQGFGYTSLDTALAGTIMHELGHSLCLANNTDPNYPSQPSGCIYDGIDNENASIFYNSSMNHNKQMFMVDYSQGANGAGVDHNDWSAVYGGIDDFADPNRSAGDPNPGVGRATLVRGITVQEAQEAQEKGTLGFPEDRPINGSVSNGARREDPLIDDIQDRETNGAKPETATDSRQVKDNGTITALAAAGVVALVATIAALIIRRRAAIK